MRKGTTTKLEVTPASSMRAPARSAEQRTIILPRAVVLVALWASVLLPAEIAAVPPCQGYCRLQTEFLEGESRCLEGNRVHPRSTLKGAAFMDLCQRVSGQFWKTDPAEEAGYYRLRTELLGQEKCLEGNKLGGAALGGAAFMDTCKEGVFGQLWKIESLGNDYYRLTTKFLEKENRCLEGNAPGGKTLGGAAFMDRCKDNAAGQRWRFAPRCTPKPGQGWPKCRRIAYPEIHIYGSRLVSDAAMDIASLVYAGMTSRFTAQYPRTELDGFEVYITNGEPWSELSGWEPFKSEYPKWPDANPDEERGGTHEKFLWISEQMICRRGVETRNQACRENREKDCDHTCRTFSQVIHELAHAIHNEFDLIPAINIAFPGANEVLRKEQWAWAVERWFGSEQGDEEQGDVRSTWGLGAENLIKSVFASATTFSCQEYWHLKERYAPGSPRDQNGVTSCW